MLLASLEPCSWKKFRPTHLLSLVSGTVRLVFGLYALPSAYPYAQDLTRLAGKSWSEIPGFVDLNVLSSNRIREDLNWKLRRQNYAVVLRARQTNATDADVTAITAYPNLTRKCRLVLPKFGSEPKFEPEPLGPNSKFSSRFSQS